MEYRFLLWPGIWSVIAVIAALGWMQTAFKHRSLRVQWHDLHTKHAIAYRKALCDGAILIDDTYKRGDPRQRSLAMGSLVDTAERISEVGAFIDRMTHSGGALSAVGRELRWFTRSIWDSHFDLPLERDRADGPALANTELCALRAIYEIYIKYFTETVIYTEDAEVHRQALLAVHMELREQEHEKLLRWPGILNVYEEFSLIA